MGIHRIALATTDKLTVYQHFGHAHGYEIADIDTGTGTFAFAEYRDVQMPCDAGSHSEAAFDAVIETLSDCEAIVVGKIGPGAAEYLLRKGVRVFEAPGVVEKIIETMLARNLFDAKQEDKGN
ncbi:MAG: dinitrogenase iron-molybdenum cofactor biosynthesis protein [Clostridiales Family XIII bacterium]|nr:dinitrogenase iron-molybdenum cofactor biosynthesis protein [Clostridiales Family XIII bacterium]